MYIYNKFVPLLFLVNHHHVQSMDGHIHEVIWVSTNKFYLN